MENVVRFTASELSLIRKCPTDTSKKVEADLKKILENQLGLSDYTVSHLHKHLEQLAQTLRKAGR